MYTPHDHDIRTTTYCLSFNIHTGRPGPGRCDAGGNTRGDKHRDGKVHTQKLSYVGVQQSKPLLSWIQVTSYYTTMLSQTRFSLSRQCLCSHAHTSNAFMISHAWIDVEERILVLLIKYASSRFTTG